MWTVLTAVWLVSYWVLMQFYLFNICPKLHHWKWQKLRITLFRTFSTSWAACWCCSSSVTIIWKLCYKLPSVITFTDLWSKCCLLYWIVPCWQAVWHVIVKICYTVSKFTRFFETQFMCSGNHVDQRRLSLHSPNVVVCQLADCTNVVIQSQVDCLSCNMPSIIM